MFDVVPEEAAEARIETTIPTPRTMYEIVRQLGFGLYFSGMQAIGCTIPGATACMLPWINCACGVGVTNTG